MNSRDTSTTGVIKLTVKNGQVVLLSTVDIDLLERQWHISPKGYAVRNPSRVNGKCRGGKIQMHREVLKSPPGVISDHINGNRLDNRRENLRICNATESNWNTTGNRGSTSRYKGVCWNKGCGKWQAAIRVKPKRFYLGIFESEVEAARAYDTAALEHHRQFARLNFPELAP